MSGCGSSSVAVCMDFAEQCAWTIAEGSSGFCEYMCCGIVGIFRGNETSAGFISSCLWLPRRFAKHSQSWIAFWATTSLPTMSRYRLVLSVLFSVELFQNFCMFLTACWIFQKQFLRNTRTPRFGLLQIIPETPVKWKLGDRIPCFREWNTRGQDLCSFAQIF